MGNRIPHPTLTVVIPRRMKETADTTLRSLALQTFKGFKTVVVPDKGKGANWARNRGFEECDTEFVLFSDSDLSWKSHAFETLLRTLQATKASYAYGRFIVHEKGKDEATGTVWGHEPWNPLILKHHNYISTMSLIRSDDFELCGGFDEKLKRYQDWDLWLNLLINHKKRGVYCNDLVFTTEVRDGISVESGEKEARQIISDKYNLGLKIFRMDKVDESKP